MPPLGDTCFHNGFRPRRQIPGQAQRRARWLFAGEEQISEQILSAAKTLIPMILFPAPPPHTSRDSKCSEQEALLFSNPGPSREWLWNRCLCGIPLLRQVWLLSSRRNIGFCPGSHSTQNSACGRVCSPAQERGPGLVPGGQDAGCGGTGGQVGFQVLPLVSR